MVASFASPDPDEINRVFAVTGGYLALLLNNTVEAVRMGAKLAGVKPAEGMLGASGLIEAIRIDGGFSEQQAQTFIELYRTHRRRAHPHGASAPAHDGQHNNPARRSRSTPGTSISTISTGATSGIKRRPPGFTTTHERTAGRTLACIRTRAA